MSVAAIVRNSYNTGPFYTASAQPSKV